MGNATASGQSKINQSYRNPDGLLATRHTRRVYDSRLHKGAGHVTAHLNTCGQHTLSRIVRSRTADSGSRPRVGSPRQTSRGPWRRTTVRRGAPASPRWDLLFSWGMTPGAFGPTGTRMAVDFIGELIGDMEICPRSTLFLDSLCPFRPCQWTS